MHMHRSCPWIAPTRDSATPASTHRTRACARVNHPPTCGRGQSDAHVSPYLILAPFLRPVRPAHKLAQQPRTAPKVFVGCPPPDNSLERGSTRARVGGKDSFAEDPPFHESTPSPPGRGETHTLAVLVHAPLCGLSAKNRRPSNEGTREAEQQLGRGRARDTYDLARPDGRRPAASAPGRVCPHHCACTQQQRQPRPR